MLRRQQTIGTGLFVASLLFLSTGCYAPLQITWDDRRPLLSPQESQRLLRPRGLLIVYSERYDQPEDDSPLSPARRLIRLYDDKGRFLGEYNQTPVNDAPISLTLSPGRHIVVSEASWRWRQVQVEVQDGQTTVVPEALLEQAAPASSSARTKVSAG